MASVVAGQPGCFRADYPSTELQAVSCATVPLRPHPPRSGPGPLPNAVGDDIDYSAQLPGTPFLSYSEGSFGSSSVSGESDGAAADSYSLQLNMNTSSTSACNGVTNCRGWQQYIFENNPDGDGTSAAYIQYWLVFYPSSCPSGYTYYAGGSGSASGCYKNSTGVSVPVQALSNLSSLTLTGTAVSGGLDQLTLSTGTSMYFTYGEDTVLNASDGWTTAEFNVFGSYTKAPLATFSSGTLLSVEILVSNGNDNSAPQVTDVGYTYETNNLTLASLTCAAADPNGPYIWFQESYGATPASTCPVTPIALAAPTVTTTEHTQGGNETFSFTWPSVSGATYYVKTANSVNTTITGNSASVLLACQKTVVVQFSSCDAMGCGYPETVLNAKNNSPCN